MSRLLVKECKLSASILSFLFILFGFMTFLPGYPILCGAFFVTLGIFQSFQNSREANDIVFSALLPIAKKDVVKGKIGFCCMIELASLLLMLIATLIRMTVLSGSDVYRSNALMNANLFSLGVAFLIFGEFNLVFVAGFFKTAYKFGKSFVIHIILTFVIIFVAEAMHYIPGFEKLNSFGFDNISLQAICLGIGIVLFVLLTFIAYRASADSFEKIDL